MTGLVLVPAVADDDSPVAVWTDADGGSVLYLSRERARALTDETRRMLDQSVVNLAELRRGSAHVALGYAHWHEYVEREFGDVALYRLIRDRDQQLAERDALIASMTLAGYTVREQHDALAVSVGTVHATQKRLGLVSERSRPPADPGPEPVDPFAGLLPRWEALARVAAQDDRGLTSLELDAETAWPLGTATGSLSKLAARGLVRTLVGAARGNRAPYVVTDAGRVKLAAVLAARNDAVR